MDRSALYGRSLRGLLRRVRRGVERVAAPGNFDVRGVVSLLLMLRVIVEIHDGVTRYLLVDRDSRTPRRWDTTQGIGKAVLDSLHVRYVEVVFGKAQAPPGHSATRIRKVHQPTEEEVVGIDREPLPFKVGAECLYRLYESEAFLLGCLVVAFR